MYTTRKQYYLLPAVAVRSGVAVLLLSLLLNLGKAVLWLHHGVGHGVGHEKIPEGSYTWTTEQPNQLPINNRKVALEVVDSERYGMKAGNDWASIFPPGLGFVKSANDEDIYIISMYHQLHCLNSFRRMMNKAGNMSHDEHDDSAHGLHCLSYMRQLILCGGDTTLEPAFKARNSDGRETVAAYGVGVTHQCHDWVQIREFAEGNWETWKEATKGFVTTEKNAIAG